MGRYKYFFYDMDDTLVFTQDKWIAAIAAYLQSHGIPYDSAVVHRYLGKNCRDISKDIGRDYAIRNVDGLPADERLRELLQLEFARKLPDEILGATKFIRSMSTRVRQFIASGSPLAVIARVVSHHRWGGYIEHFISSESVAKGKPDPEIYTKLCTHLGAEPGECLIFEDSPAGIEAAHSAGIQCVVINPKVPTDRSPWIIAVAQDFEALVNQQEFKERVLSQR
ncbi:MAG: HAD family phosphatase [Sphaerochaeta sp.]